MDIVESVRPLAAILAALIGACLIMLTGRRPNVRETVSFVTAVVMFCIIASMIGARGLGQEVLMAINRIDVGRGFEAGISIVIMGIVIDRITQGLARKWDPNNK